MSLTRVEKPDRTSINTPNRSKLEAPISHLFPPVSHINHRLCQTSTVIHQVVTTLFQNHPSMLPPPLHLRNKVSPAIVITRTAYRIGESPLISRCQSVSHRKLLRSRNLPEQTQCHSPAFFRVPPLTRQNLPASQRRFTNSSVDPQRRQMAMLPRLPALLHHQVEVYGEQHAKHRRPSKKNLLLWSTFERFRNLKFQKLHRSLR